ncbi:hypothetical protein ACTXPS_16505 [Brachybacterium tyrofermentans]|uniref:hypothetical protein n=1 Tax=Brachybacterium tyrofermentans TaxID=47848 RepID=UPI003FD5BCCA
MSTLTLHHFTSPEHLPLILEAGFLKVTESNISFKREHAGPDVVWLTTHETADAGLGLQAGAFGALANDKTAIRFTVEVDSRQIHKWRIWAAAHGSSAETVKRLSEVGGGSGSWRVTERPIMSAQWTEIRDMRTGEQIPFPTV